MLTVTRSAFRRYGVVPLVVAVAVLIRLLLWPLLGTELPFLLLWPAVMVCAWYGGLGPGLLATLLAAVTAGLLFFEPSGSLAAVTREGWMGMALFGALGGVISLLLGLLHRARRRVEAHARELFEQSERFRVTLTSIGDAVLATDARGRVTFLNDVAQALTGWKCDEAAGEPFVRVMRIVHEETRQPAVNPVEQVLATGRLVGLANHTVLLSRGGREVPIDDSAAPIRDAGGAVGGVVLVFRDITEQRRAQEALRRSERHYRALAASLPGAVFTCEPDGACDYCNAWWLEYTGVTAEQSAGWGWAAALHPEDAPRVTAVWGEVVRTGAVFECEYRFRRSDGRYRWFLGRAVPLKDEGGRVVKWFGTAVDIDQQKQLEEALKQADRRKDEFLAMLGHELRNPLAPIRNAVEILRLAGAEEADVRQSREIIERQVRQMARLVDDLLDVSRISRGKVRLDKQRVALAAVVGSAVEATRPLIDARRHELTVSLPQAPVWLEADAIRLTQVFANLLNNAAKYTDEGGRIWLSAEGDGSEVRVRDSGVGIAPDMLPRVFELFAQSERSLSRSEGGLGVGLTLVRRLVELHGGSVEARSEGSGKGSEFVVRLPALRESREAEGSRSVARGDMAGPSRRVLVVDDNRDVADSLARLLALSGHDVRTAYDGPAALEAARLFRPEVVLLDIGLPGMDGYQVARQMRGQEWAGEAFLAALTGYGQEEDRRRSREAGFAAHLVKPIDPDELRALLAHRTGRITAAD